jgi:hypothetical protein
MHTTSHCLILQTQMQILHIQWRCSFTYFQVESLHSFRFRKKPRLLFLSRFHIVACPVWISTDGDSWCYADGKYGQWQWALELERASVDSSCYCVIAWDSVELVSSYLLPFVTALVLLTERDSKFSEVEFWFPLVLN